jgi:hypothetical protein
VAAQQQQEQGVVLAGVVLVVRRPAELGRRRAEDQPVLALPPRVIAANRVDQPPGGFTW